MILYFVTWKIVQAAKKVPEQVAWDPSLAKREFLLEYVLQASPAGATLAGWDTYAIVLYAWVNWS